MSGCLQINNNDQNEEVKMNNKIITVTVTCTENEKCLFKGEDLFIEINITNNLDRKIGFPLKYIQKKGPYIRLIDQKTGVESFLKSQLADWALKRKFKTIRSGESVTIEWIILIDEIKEFGGNIVDLIAEITIAAGIKVDRKIQEIEETGKLHIIGGK